MYRTTEDFLADWQANAAGTLNVFKAITDDKMDVAIVDGHNSLGWLAWHLVSTAGFFGQFAKLQIPTPGPTMKQPETMEEIVAAYEQVIEAYTKEVAALTDEEMLEEVAGFGGPTMRGKLLRALIDHQSHHRGQMTVLLRQAGLTVPPVMGPTKEMQ